MQIEREKELQRQLVLEARQAAHEAAAAAEAAKAEAAAAEAAAAREAGNLVEPMDVGQGSAAVAMPSSPPDRKRRRGVLLTHTLTLKGVFVDFFLLIGPMWVDLAEAAGSK